MRIADNETTVLIADPPWPHANGSRTNSGKSPKYPLMNLKQLSALGVGVQKLVGPNAVLYLWSTGPHLPGALETIDAWGFTYRSFHVWAKHRPACGFWARSDAELCLIAERGKPAKPLASQLPRSTITGKPETVRHSAKPDAIHLIAERLWPAARKIEFFARTTRKGWEGYGSDLGHRITEHGICAFENTI